MGYFTDTSTHNVDVQESCVKAAAIEGLRSGTTALIASAIVVLGACKAFPAFNRSLNVSARTALIVTPAFGFFFLKGELKMNECATRHKMLQRHLEEVERAEKAAKAAAA